MRHGARVKATLGTAVLVAAVGACGSDGNDTSEAGTAAGPVITIHRAWNSYPTAEIKGTLTEDEDCLFVTEQVVFWPKGTTWDASANAVIQTDGTKSVVGEQVIGGGGSYEPDADFDDLLGSSDAAEKVTSCVEKTRAQAVLIVTPAS